MTETMSATIEIQDTVNMLVELAEGDHRKVRRAILNRLASERTDPSPYYTERVDNYCKLLDHLRVVSGI